MKPLRIKHCRKSLIPYRVITQDCLRRKMRPIYVPRYGRALDKVGLLVLELMNALALISFVRATALRELAESIALTIDNTRWLIALRGAVEPATRTQPHCS